MIKNVHTCYKGASAVLKRTQKKGPGGAVEGGSANPSYLLQSSLMDGAFLPGGMVTLNRLRRPSSLLKTSMV